MTPICRSPSGPALAAFMGLNTGSWGAMSHHQRRCLLREPLSRRCASPQARCRPRPRSALDSPGLQSTGQRATGAVCALCTTAALARWRRWVPARVIGGSLQQGGICGRMHCLDCKFWSMVVVSLQAAKHPLPGLPPLSAHSCVNCEPLPPTREVCASMQWRPAKPASGHPPARVSRRADAFQVGGTLSLRCSVHRAAGDSLNVTRDSSAQMFAGQFPWECSSLSCRKSSGPRRLARMQASVSGHMLASDCVTLHSVVPCNSWTARSLDSGCSKVIRP
jgi:hypothetical protein